MRRVACLPAILLALATACGGHAERTVATRVVGCGNVILRPRSGTTDGYRPILAGAVSVPPAHLPQTAPTRDRTWPFWEKAGLLVRAGHGPVDVRVPRRSRDRAAILWGNGGRPVSSLRITRCPGRRWNAYAGGFFIKRRSGCVPVTFRAGGRTVTMIFGLRTRCGDGQP